MRTVAEYIAQALNVEELQQRRRPFGNADERPHVKEKFMKCNFCGREVPCGTQECPYCHYRFEIEATVLNPQERDEFEGVTIDESGYEETAAKDERRPEQRERYERREEYSNKNGGGPKIYVKNLNGCLIALFIFFMPLFLVIAGIGIVYYFISSFLGWF